MITSRFLILLLLSSSYGCYPAHEAYRQDDNCRDVAGTKGPERSARNSDRLNQWITEDDASEIVLVIAQNSYSPLDFSGEVTLISFNGKRRDCNYLEMAAGSSNSLPDLNCKISSHVYNNIDTLRSAVNMSDFNAWPNSLFPERRFTLGFSMSIGYREARGKDLVFKEARDGCIFPAMRDLESQVDTLMD